MTFDTTFIVEIATLLFGGGGLAIFFDRKQKKAALELDNKQKEIENKQKEIENQQKILEQDQNKESFAMKNIKERYNELEVRHNELVERHKGVVADKQTMLEEMLELKKIISDKDIEIGRLKAKNKELSTRLKNKGKE